MLAVDSSLKVHKFELLCSRGGHFEILTPVRIELWAPETHKRRSVIRRSWAI
jgi:hypothetical protein